MEWWATQVINESRDKGLNPLQTVHRLEELWPAMQSPAHRRYWIKAIAPLVGLSEAQLSAHFSKIPEEKTETKGPLPEIEGEDILPHTPSHPESNNFVLHEIISHLLRWGAGWSKIHEERDGSLLQQCFQGTELELPFARSTQGGEFKPKALVEALKTAGLELYVARALANEVNEEAQAAGRDTRKLLRDLCLQFLSQRKNALIKRLAIDLKNSSGDEKTAQILQEIQIARKEVEELKKFSFSL